MTAGVPSSSWGCFSGGLSLLSDPPQLEMRLQQEHNDDGEHDRLWWCWLWRGSARSGDQGCGHHRVHVPALDLLPGLDLQSLVQDTLLWRRGGNQHVEVRWVFGCDSSSRSPNVSPSVRHTLDFEFGILEFASLKVAAPGSSRLVWITVTHKYFF